MNTYEKLNLFDGKMSGEYVTIDNKKKFIEEKTAAGFKLIYDGINFNLPREVKSLGNIVYYNRASNHCLIFEKQ